MPKSLSGGGGSGSNSDGVFSNIMVNTFAARINSTANSFLVYNSDSTNPIFKIDGSTNVVTVTGDLDVVGNVTFTTVSNIAVTSSMMSLANSNTVSDAIDIGFYGQYNSSGIKYRGLVKSISLNRWILFKDITTTPSTVITLAGSYRDNLEVNDLYYGGTGDTLSALKTDVDGFPDSLKDLTSAEITQLTNIGANTISATQWGYLAAQDQTLATTSNITSNNMTINGNALMQNAWLNNQTLYMRDVTDTYHYIKFNPLVNGLQYTGWQNHLWTASSSDTNLMYLNEYGGLTIGTSDIAVNTYKLYVNGVSYFNGALTVNGTASATTLTGTLSTATQPNITSAAGLVTIASATNTITLADVSVAATAWPFVNAMNQSVASSASPSFVTVTANLTGNASGTAATVTNATQAAITTLANLATIGGAGSTVTVANNAINSTKWGYLAALNQGLTTTSTVAFGPTTITSTNGSPLIIRSGNSVNRASISVGRTTFEGTFAVVGAADEYYTGTTAGDVLFRNDNVSTSGSGAVGSGSNLMYFGVAGSTTPVPGMILNKNGGITIGTSDLASSTNKLYVNGSSYHNGYSAFIADATNGAICVTSGTMAAATATYQYGSLSTALFAPTNGSTASRGFSSQCSFAALSTKTISEAVGFYVSNAISGSNAGIITNIYGLLIDTGTAVTGTVTNAFGAYIKPPAHGTNRTALMVYGAGAGTYANNVANFFTGDGNTAGGIGIGRTARELHITMASGSNQYFTGVAAGDCVMIADTNTSKIWAGVTTTSGVFADSVGSWAPGSDNGQTLGKTGNRWTVVYATTGTINTSDRTEKNTIAPSTLGLEFINHLTPVSYKYNNRNRTHYGLIAQDVKDVLDDLKIPAEDFAGYIDPAATDPTDLTPKGLRYSEFISILIQAVKELRARVIALESA